MNELSFDALAALLDAVFAPAGREGWLTIMVDLPDERAPDHAAWADRRRIAAEWFGLLNGAAARLPFEAVCFCSYPNVGSNNNDLPATVSIARAPSGPAEIPAGEPVALDTVLRATSVVLALTEFSATAPLKLLARDYRFRGATLPGFSRAMIPVLGLDYERVNRRVLEFKERMDRAEGVSVALEAEGDVYTAFFDLRFRTGHASGGLLREPGTVGNLPSGEAYIVPYEGERPGTPSRTAGELPVQFGDELVVYRLEQNRATEVLGSGPRAAGERARLAAEPAYGNMAEVGIGVLGEWGVQAVGSTLLDEKLGLHVAFGRSDHFGGITGPDAFRERGNVVHIDRVYVPSVQPLVRVREVTFSYPDDPAETIIRADTFVV
jgi:hypothetical protein